MDERVQKIRSGLQWYWATNELLQQLIMVEKIYVEGELSDAPTLRELVEQVDKQSLPAGLAPNEVLCLMTLFRWWTCREGQEGTKHKTLGQRSLEARTLYPEIPVKSFTEAITKSKRFDAQIKEVLGLTVVKGVKNDGKGEQTRENQAKRKVPVADDQGSSDQSRKRGRVNHPAETSDSHTSSLPIGTVIFEDVTDNPYFNK